MLLCRSLRLARLGGPRKKPPREATGHTTAQNRFCLGLLPFGPDPVHSRPLHRARPLLAALFAFRRGVVLQTLRRVFPAGFFPCRPGPPPRGAAGAPYFPPGGPRGPAQPVFFDGGS